jgi:hypothetical protein
VPDTQLDLATRIFITILTAILFFPVVLFSAAYGAVIYGCEEVRVIHAGVADMWKGK